jgi:predicted GNAT family acetyltransferase
MRSESGGAIAGIDSHPVDVHVRDDPSELRYEAWIGDRLAGVIRYRREPGVIVLVHTDVEPDLEGSGVGAALVRGALDDIRARGLSVAIVCPFVASYVSRHEGYADLIVPDPAG